MLSAAALAILTRHWPATPSIRKVSANAVNNFEPYDEHLVSDMLASRSRHHYF